MKILWQSNSPWARTGYGVQTKLVVPKLIEAGHDAAYFAFYGLSGGVLDYGGTPVYPNLRDSWGNDALHAHAAHWFGGKLEDGLIVTLMDVWVLHSNLFRAPVRSAAWVPIDHEPPPAKVAAFFEQSDCIPIAMSRFGQEQLRQFDPLYVPHAIDTSLFRPIDRDKARELVGLPKDRFIVGMVAANKGDRKSYAETIQAFVKLREKRTDAMLYLHCEALGQDGGYDLTKLLSALEVSPDDCMFPDQYQLQVTGFDDDYMANVYSSLDVLANPAKGEGFGVPIIEAQACGTPVIVTNNTAMTEVGEVGWQVEGYPVWTGLESWQTIPSVDEIHWAMNEAYDYAPQLRESAREHALKYDLDLVVKEHWLPALDEIEARHAELEPKALAA